MQPHCWVQDPQKGKASAFVQWKEGSHHTGTNQRFMEGMKIFLFLIDQAALKQEEKRQNEQQHLKGVGRMEL